MQKIDQNVGIGLLLVLIVIGTGYSGYYLGRYAILEPPPGTPTPTPTAVPSSPVGLPLPLDISKMPPPQSPPVVKEPIQKPIDPDISHWMKTYKSKYGFSFRIPPGFVVKDYSSATSAHDQMLVVCQEENCGERGVHISISTDDIFLLKTANEAFDLFLGPSHDIER